jgi:HAMP domain-containing protein
MALVIACLGFVVFRRMVDRIARLAVNVRLPIAANRETPGADEAVVRVPALGQVAEIGQLAGAFRQMLEDLRTSTSWQRRSST